MNELEIIENSKVPITKDSIINDLKKLGVEKESIIIVHSSLSKLGWVCGGAITVIQSLIDLIGENGTIIMPSQTAHYSDPVEWCNPPVPKEWHPIIKDTMPAFSPDITPSLGMGQIAETFRTLKNVSRSSHPQYSFSGWGYLSKYILKDQPYNFPLGEGSPLEKLYNLDANVLLLGVDYDVNTSFHLAEYRLNNKLLIKNGSPIMENDERIWKEFTDINLSTDSFVDIGLELEVKGFVKSGGVGMAKSKLFKVKDSVDFCYKWMLDNNK
ncbi:MAG: aminoglycoside N(3)-acetyltransferase [Paraclostridium sp.]